MAEPKVKKGTHGALAAPHVQGRVDCLPAPFAKRAWRSRFRRKATWGCTYSLVGGCSVRPFGRDGDDVTDIRRREKRRRGEEDRCVVSSRYVCGMGGRRNVVKDEWGMEDAHATNCNATKRQMASTFES
jgi:hypothetical protein